MRKKFIFIFTVLICLSSNPAFAHQDTIIELQGNNLIGLPEEYQPAIFDLEKKYLRLGDKEMVFPECLSLYLPDDMKYEVTVSSSWYHDPTHLPSYLLITVKLLERDFSYSLLFDMDSLDVLEAHVLGDARKTKEQELGFRFFRHPLKIDKCIEYIRSSGIIKNVSEN